MAKTPQFRNYWSNDLNFVTGHCMFNVSSTKLVFELLECVIKLSSVSQ